MQRSAWLKPGTNRPKFWGTSIPPKKLISAYLDLQIRPGIEKKRQAAKTSLCSKVVAQSADVFADIAVSAVLKARPMHFAASR